MTQDTKTFEQWEKLPSDIALTKGECNQLHNILTTKEWLNLPANSDIERILAKLEREI